MIFININSKWDFIMGKNVAPLWSCHGLHMADGEFVLKWSAIAYVLYSTQTGIRLNRGHYIKGSHPFRNTLLLKLWIPQRLIGGLRKCFKVYISEGALICLRKRIRSVLHKTLSIPFTASCNLISYEYVDYLKPMIHGSTCRKRHVEYEKIWGCLIVYHPLKHHSTPSYTTYRTVYHRL